MWQMACYTAMEWSRSSAWICSFPAMVTIPALERPKPHSSPQHCENQMWSSLGCACRPHRSLQSLPGTSPGACMHHHCLALQACPVPESLSPDPQELGPVFEEVCSRRAWRRGLVLSCHLHHPQLLAKAIDGTDCGLLLCSEPVATRISCMTPGGRTVALRAAHPDNALLVRSAVLLSLPT